MSKPPATTEQLDGRVAVVIGGSGGIGAEICRVLAEAGATTVVVDRDVEKAEALADEVRRAGGTAQAHELDLRDFEAVRRLLASVAAEHDRLDVLVNAAGVIADASPLDVTVEELESVFAVNFTATVVATQAAARVMAEGGGGAIVNLTTLGVDVAMPSLAAYTASKAALSQYSRSLALEVAPSGIRVNLLSPGWVDTPMTRRHAVDEGGDAHAQLLSDWEQRSPLGRPADARDQAMAVLFLVSDAARAVTGMTMRVNAGTSMPW